MPQFGGTDTRGLAQAASSGRQQRLQAEMAAIEQQNRASRESQAQIGQGLGMLAQDEQMQRRESLEAARQGLEYNPETRRYEESAETKAQKQEARDIAKAEAAQQFQLREQANLRANVDTAQRVQQSGAALEQGRQRLELSKKDLALKAQKLDLDFAKERRYIRELQSGNADKAKEARTELTNRYDKQMRNLDRMELDVRKAMQRGGDLTAIFATHPGMRDMMAGSDPSDLESMVQRVKAKRSQVTLNHVAMTGDMGEMDINAPENQEFIALRGRAQDFLNASTQWNTFFLNRSAKDRHRFLNSLTAKVLQMSHLAQAQAAVRGDPISTQIAEGVRGQLGKFGQQAPAAAESATGGGR